MFLWREVYYYLLFFVNDFLSHSCFMKVFYYLLYFLISFLPIGQFFSGIFLPLNVLLLVCRMEVGHATLFALVNRMVKLYCLTDYFFCLPFTLPIIFLTY
jgi:hypothetical protein